MRYQTTLREAFLCRITCIGRYAFSPLKCESFIHNYVRFEACVIEQNRKKVLQNALNAACSSGHCVNLASKFFVLMFFKNSMFDCFIPEVDSAARRI